MRIVVTGRGGQVARSIMERGALSGDDIVALGRPQLDLAGDAEEIFLALEAARPQAIVSAAAYTAVDKAEVEPEQAFAINAVGPGHLAVAASRLGVPLLHLSTDYVFDGTKQGAYVETDATGPNGTYGASKLAGEQAVLAGHDDVAILRTAWVYSPFGTNFVKTMLRLAADRDEVGVVGDQFGNPTSALDLADGILAVAANLVDGNDRSQRGIFHMAGSGDSSWAQFAEWILAESAAVGGPGARVRPIATEDYPTPAIRPANSRLDCEKLDQVHGVCLSDWRQSTTLVIERLVRGGN